MSDPRMMYTTTPPDSGADRTRLFACPGSAAAGVRDGRPMFEVAVRFDARNRRVVPLRSGGWAEWTMWATPGEAHADGSVTARGPIPAELYTGRVAAPAGGGTIPRLAAAPGCAEVA